MAFARRRSVRGGRQLQRVAWAWQRWVYNANWTALAQLQQQVYMDMQRLRQCLDGLAASCSVLQLPRLTPAGVGLNIHAFHPVPVPNSPTYPSTPCGGPGRAYPLRAGTSRYPASFATCWPAGLPTERATRRNLPGVYTHVRRRNLPITTATTLAIPPLPTFMYTR